MPIPSNLSPTLKTLEALDPNKDSLNANVEKIQQRSCLENFFGFLIYLLTFTMRAKNPDLDKATTKIIGIANEALKNPVEMSNEELDTIKRAFSKLQTIIEKNQGSDGENLQAVISRVQKLNPVSAPPNSFLKPDVAAQKVYDLLETHSKTIAADLKNKSTNPPESVKKLGEEIVTLLTTLSTPLPLIDKDQDRRDSLLIAILNTDVKTLNNTVPKINPVVLKQIIGICLALPKTYSKPFEALYKIIDGVTDLQAKMIIEAFPTMPTLTLPDANRRDFLSKYVHDPKNETIVTQSFNCRKFLLSPACEKFVHKLPEDKKTAFLKALSAFSVFPLYKAADGDKWQQELIDFVNRCPPQHRRLALESMTCNLEPDFLAKLSLHDNADKKLVQEFLSQPSEITKDGFDRSFHLYLKTITSSTSPNKEKVLEWVLECVCQVVKSKHEEQFFNHFQLNNEDTAFLAQRLHRLPAPVISRISDQFLLKLANEIATHPDPHAELNLKAIVHSKESFRIMYKNLQEFKDGLLALFKTGEPRFQSQFLLILMSLGHDAEALSLFKTFRPATQEAWRLVGQGFLLDHNNAKFPPELLTIIFEHHGPEAMLAFLNGVADKSNSSPLDAKQEAMTAIVSAATTTMLLAIPRSLLMKNLCHVNPKCQNELLRSLEPAEVRQAVNAWWHNFDWSDENSLFANGYPFARLLEVVEDPFKLMKIAGVIGIKVRNYYTGNKSCDPLLRDALQALENHPWKLWVSVHLFDVKHLLSYDSADLRTKYPNCFEIFEWFDANGIESSKNLAAAVEANQWQQAYDLFKAMNVDQKNQVLAYVRGPSPEELAKCIHLMPKVFLFAAIFNLTASNNLLKAILTGLAQENGYSTLHNLINDPALSESVHFDIRGLRIIFSKLSSVGVPSLMFIKDIFADIKVSNMDEINFHKAILSLDPFFKPLIPLPNAPQTIQIPAEQSQIAQWRAQRLYGAISLERAFTAEGQRFLKETSHEKLSLAHYLNPPHDFSDFEIVVGSKTIKAHRFILNAVFPFFQSVFAINKGTSTINIDKDPEMVHKVIEMAYTGNKPNLNPSQKQLFYATLDYFNTR